MSRGRYYLPLCPANPAHGKLYDWPSETHGFYCPHAEHDGRPKSHPAGPLSPTPAFFTTAEVEAANQR